MSTRNLMRVSMAGALIALLAACGGDGDSSPGPVASTAAPGAPTSTSGPSDSLRQSTFISDYGNGVSALNSYSGLTNTAFIDLFDDGFLDAGYTKPQVRNNLAQEAAAMAVSADLSGFASVKLSALSISNCDARNVCTLNATVANTDVDATAAAFTTQLKFENGKFRLFGDQKNS